MSISSVREPAQWNLLKSSSYGRVNDKVLSWRLNVMNGLSWYLVWKGSKINWKHYSPPLISKGKQCQKSLFLIMNDKAINIFWVDCPKTNRIRLQEIEWYIRKWKVRPVGLTGLVTGWYTFNTLNHFEEHMKNLKYWLTFWIQIQNKSLGQHIYMTPIV